MFQVLRGRFRLPAPPGRSVVLAVVAGLLVGAVLAPIGAWSAGPETDSASGIAKVKAPNRCQVTNTGMDVTADTKVAATMVTDLPGTYVERVVRKESNDRLKICLNKQAVGTVRVSWIAHNGDALADKDEVFTGRVNLTPVDFVHSAGAGQYFQDVVRIRPDQDQNVDFYAPVHLPQGVTITRVVVVGTDNTGGSTSFFNFDLFRTEITPTSSGNPNPDFNTFASAISAGSDVDAVREIADTTFSCSGCVNPALVDNTQYQYGLRVNMRDFGPGIVEVYAAYIEYILP